MSTDILSQIHAELGDLEPNSQRHVLEYVRSMKQTSKGMGADLLRQHVGTISAIDAKMVVDAIEAGCEQVDVNEW